MRLSNFPDSQSQVNNMARDVAIDPLSCSSLKIVPMFNDVELAAATGFLVEHSGTRYLITNWHVASGRNTETEEPLDRNHASIPNKFRVTFHQKDQLARWIERDIPIRSDSDEPLWLEHPRGRVVDVVAIPITDDLEGEAALFDLDLNLSQVDMEIFPGSECFVIGFPLGLATGSAWPIWKTAHLASDHYIDYRAGEPAFLIDATTRSGMSGSPVVVRTTSSYRTRNGTTVFLSGAATKFLGVYSGCIHEDSEIGKVWRPFVIREIIEKQLFYGEGSGLVRLTDRNKPCDCGSEKRYKHCHGIFPDVPLQNDAAG